MTETAKERIENEIKSVEKRLHRGRNYGKTYNTGVKEGLMIARAHIIDSLTTDKLSVGKLQEQLNTTKKALTEISSSREYFSSGEIPKFLPTEDAQIAIDALAAIGGDDD